MEHLYTTPKLGHFFSLWFSATLDNVYHNLGSVWHFRLDSVSNSGNLGFGLGFVCIKLWVAHTQVFRAYYDDLLLLCKNLEYHPPMANYFVVIPEVRPEVEGFEVQDYIYYGKEGINK